MNSVVFGDGCSANEMSGMSTIKLHPRKHWTQIPLWYSEHVTGNQDIQKEGFPQRNQRDYDTRELLNTISHT